VAKFGAETKEKYPDKTILVTTHGGVIDAMHILFPQKEKTITENVTIYVFEL
jgi:broad specificity phosphatase PhoE